MGAVGGDLLKTHKEDWREKLVALDSVDWNKKNRDWENVCIVANSVVSNRQARSATKAYLKNKLGLALTDAEAKSIAHNAASQAAYPPAAVAPVPKSEDQAVTA